MASRSQLGAKAPRNKSKCDEDIRSRGTFQNIRGDRGGLDPYFGSDRSPYDFPDLGDSRFHV